MAASVEIIGRGRQENKPIKGGGEFHEDGVEVGGFRLDCEDDGDGL